METHHDDHDDQPSQEKGTSNDDHQQQEAATRLLVRSYDCIFCKRGFSNAQALGGHMNIHRKDKAYKLKQAAAASSISNNSNQQSFNISKIRASYSQIPTIRPSSMEVMGSTQERSFATKNDKTQLVESRKLPSFVQRAASSSEEEDLDLELRLGPEPHQDSSTSAITGTKKFF